MVVAGVVYTVSAPSGAGKTSLVRALLREDDGIALSVSHTTRKRREGEVDGRDYFFVAEAEFRRMIDAGEFIEHAQVFGNLYGTSHGALRAQLDAGRDVLLEIDWQGARQAKRAYPDAVAIFILPPSRTTLAQRLRDRGQDSAEIVSARMAGAIREIEHYVESDFLIVNDDFDMALRQLRAIVTAQRLKFAPQSERHAELIRNLLRADG